MITIKIRRLDRMTLIRRYKSQKAWEEFIATLGVANIHCANGDLKKIKKDHATTFRVSYPGKSWGTGVSFDFFSVQKKPAIAINCTPSKLSDDDWADFLGLLECMFPFGPKQIWETFKISALEVAVDVKVPFDELVCIVPKVTIVDPGYLELGTLYLGHEFGRRSYSIYDKRRQLANKEKIDLGYDLTRIEVTLRQTGKTLGQLTEFSSNPFGNLLAIRKETLIEFQKKNPVSTELDKFLKSVLAGAVAQTIYLSFDPYARKNLLKLLKPLALRLNAEAHQWGAWVAQQQLALQCKYLGVGSYKVEQTKVFVSEAQ